MGPALQETVKPASPDKRGTDTSSKKAKSVAMAASAVAPSVRSSEVSVVINTANHDNPSTVVDQCWFECGEASDLLNIGNSRSVRLVCALCNSARRAIDCQGRYSPESKAALKDMKANRQGEYKSLVRRSRIAPVPQGMRDSDSQRRRQSEISKALTVVYSQLLETTSSVQNNAPVLWVTEKQFIAWHKHHEDMSNAAAEDKWKTDVANVDIARYQDGNELRLALNGIPETVGTVARGVKRSMSASQDIDKLDHFRLARKRLKTDSMPTVADAMFADVRNEVFKGKSSAPGPSSSAMAHLSAPSKMDDNVGIISLDMVKGAALAIEDHGPAEIIGCASVATDSRAAENRTQCRQLHNAPYMSCHQCHIFHQYPAQEYIVEKFASWLDTNVVALLLCMLSQIPLLQYSCHGHIECRCDLPHHCACLFCMYCTYNGNCKYHFHREDCTVASPAQGPSGGRGRRSGHWHPWAAPSGH